MFIKVHRKLKNMHLSSHTSLIFAYRKGLHTDIFLKHGQDLSLKQVYPELQIVLKTFVQKGAALDSKVSCSGRALRDLGPACQSKFIVDFLKLRLGKKLKEEEKG